MRKVLGKMTVVLKRKTRSPELVPVTLAWKNGPPPEEVTSWQRLSSVKTKGLLGWAPSLARSGYLVWCGPPLLNPTRPVTGLHCLRWFTEVEGESRVHWFPNLVELHMSQRDKGGDKWVRNLRISTTTEHNDAWRKVHGGSMADTVSFLLRDGKYPAAWILTDRALVIYIKITAGPLFVRSVRTTDKPDAEPSLQPPPDESQAPAQSGD